MPFSFHRPLFLFFTALLTAGTARAATVTVTPVFTSNPSLFSGQYAPGGVEALDRTRTDNIFRFVVFQFDVSGFTPGLPKILTVYDGSTSSPVTASVVALGASILDGDGGPDGDFADIIGPADTQDYPAMVAAAAERRLWFDANVISQPPGGTLSFATNISWSDPPPTTLDVTAIVDAWIDGSVPNYGFAIHSPSRAIGINGVNFVNHHLRPTVTQVPEPGAVSLGALVGLMAATRRRR